MIFLSIPLNCYLLSALPSHPASSERLEQATHQEITPVSYPSLETYGFWRRQAKPNGTIVVKYLNAHFWTIFCNRRKWYLLQVDSMCILDSNDALIGCDFTQIEGCYWELLLERGREILWKRKRMFYCAVAWPSKNAHVSAAIWFHAAHAIHGSQPGGLKQKEMKFKPRIKLNHNIYKNSLNKFRPQKDFLSSSYIHVPSSWLFFRVYKRIRKEVNKSEPNSDVKFLWD